jgi:hypothetical protein
MSGLFGSRYRAQHEADGEYLIDTLLAASADEISESERVRRVMDRDRDRWLEFDSSALNYFFLDIFVDRFPESKFVLTLREPVSWLDSVFNQFLQPDIEPHWLEFAQWWFEPHRYEFSEHERVLQDHGLFPVDCYLERWAEHTRSVVSTVPSERLLVVRTSEIDTDIQRIADFVGVPADRLNTAKSHLYQATTRHNLVDQIDPGFLEERVEYHCGALVQEFFPQETPAAGQSSESESIG